MTMVAADGTVVYNGALSQIKSRGNSTFLYYDKKSYQIKLDGKSDLLGLNESGKTWVLLAGYGDATQMHDKLFKDLAAQVGLAFSPDCDWVDLYYDGEYRGTYLLSEKNNVNENTVNITDMEKLYEQADPSYGDNAVTAEGTNAYGQSYSYTQGLAGPDDLTGGWLLELNHNTIDEANGFHTRQEVAFNVKSPEFGSQEAIQYISEYYQEFEDAVYATDSEGNYTGLNPDTGKYYYDYCDLDSLVRMFLVQQLSLNTDAYASSMYFYKDAGGKMYAGPIWDMEMSCGTGWDEYIAPSRDFLQLRYLTEALMQIPSFINAVEQYFDETFALAVQDLLGIDGVIAEYTDTLSASAAMNYVLWPYVRIGNPSHADHLWGGITTYSDVVTDLSDWLECRLDILTQRYSQHPDVPTGTIIFQKGTALTRTYGDAAFTNAASAEGVAGGFTYSSSNSTVAIVDPATGKVTIMGAGSTVITATAAELSGQYQLTILPKKITALTWDSNRLIYTGQPLAPTATAVDGLVEGDSVEFSVPAATEAGTYEVSAVSKNPNYVVAENAENKTCTFIISMPEIQLSGTDSQEVTWYLDGTTIRLSGFVSNKDSKITVTVTATLSSGSTSASADVSAGGKSSVALGGVSYSVDASQLTVKPVNVELSAGATVPTVTEIPELTEEEQEAVESAAGSDSNKFDNIVAAVAPSTAEIVEQALADIPVGEKPESVTLEISQKLDVLDYTPGESYKVDITPVYTVKTGEGDAETTIATGTLTNDQLTVPVQVTLQVPAKMTLTDGTTYIRHERSDGRIEYIRPSVDNDAKTVTFQIAGFSVFEVVSDSRTGSVTFDFGETGTQKRVFTPEDIGKALPTVTVSENQRFDGWRIGDQVYTELTDALLTALSSGGTVTAEAVITDTTPTPPSGGSGGSSVTTYSITVQKSANGSVTASKTRASKGDSITLTISADEGYVLDTLTVTDKSGDKISLTEKNGKYTFEMPASAVTVQAVFREESAVEALPFTDVSENDWYYDAVAYAYENGLMEGTGYTTFAPSMTTTRSMLAALLYRLEDEPTVSGAAGFTDVPAGTWYTDAVTWAASEGIVKGVGDGTSFAPNNTITREQMAVMLYRYAQCKGYSVSQVSMVAHEYTDYGQVSDWAQYAMDWAVATGLITGTSDTTLSPQGQATRAEIATIFMRFCENVVK